MSDISEILKSKVRGRFFGALVGMRSSHPVSDSLLRQTSLYAHNLYSYEWSTVECAVAATAFLHHYCMASLTSASSLNVFHLIESELHRFLFFRLHLNYSSQDVVITMPHETAHIQSIELIRTKVNYKLKLHLSKTTEK